MSVVATFEDRLGQANKAKLVIDITNDVVGPETIKIAWGVVGPSSVLKQQVIGTPDFTGVAPSAVNTVTVDLPVLGTLYEQGTYQVLVRITRDSDDALLVNHNESYDYSPFDSCGDVIKSNFSETVYCSAKVLLIKDETLYSPYTPSRTTTVVHPTIPGSIDGDKASQLLTLTGQPLDTETVIIGTKTYTFQTTLTESDGNVLIGPTAEASLDNLISAINLGVGAGTLYASVMTAGQSDASKTSTTVMTATAKTAGAAGNLIATTETLTNGSWGAATMTGGSDDATNTVSNDAAFQIALTYRNVSYTVNRDMEYSLTTLVGTGASAVTFVEQHSLNESTAVTINCVDICDIQTCIDDEIGSLEGKATAAGGVHNMKTQDRDRWNLLNLYLDGYNLAALCFDTANKTYYYNKIKDLLQCTGNCCDDTTVSEIPASGELQFINGADGKTILYGTANPTTEGNNGDFYIKTSGGSPSEIFGPKAAGVWPSGISMIGAAGAAGADGATVLNGAVDPTTEGVNGDFYINTVTFQIFGPKTGGAWGSGTDLIGGGSITAWTPFTTELQVNWNTGTGDGALSWRRKGHNLYIKGDLIYTNVDPGTTEVALLDKTWLPSGVVLPPEGIHGFVVQDTSNEIHGVIRESKVGSTMLIWFAPAAAFTVSTTYRVNVTIPIE